MANASSIIVFPVSLITNDQLGYHLPLKWDKTTTVLQTDVMLDYKDESFGDNLPFGVVPDLQNSPCGFRDLEDIKSWGNSISFLDCGDTDVEVAIFPPALFPQSTGPSMPDLNHGAFPSQKDS